MRLRRGGVGGESIFFRCGADPAGTKDRFVSGHGDQTGLRVVQAPRGAQIALLLQFRRKAPRDLQKIKHVISF
jgi:hypothetical protein